MHLHAAVAAHRTLIPDRVERPVSLSRPEGTEASAHSGIDTPTTLTGIVVPAGPTIAGATRRSVCPG